MRNLLSSLFFYIARVAAAVLQLKLVEKFFGSQYAGLNALLNQLAFYVALIEMGLATAAISLLYEPLKAGDHTRASALLYALRRDTSKLMFLALPVVAALVYVYARSLHSSLPFFVIIVTLALTAASGLITLMSIHYQAFLNASEQIYQTYYVLAAGYLLKTGVGLALAIVGENYFYLPLTIVVLTVGEVFVLRWRFLRSFPQYVRRASADIVRVIRQRAKFVLFHRVGGLIYYQSDFIILSLVASLSVVKEYAQVQYAAAGILGLTSAVFNALTTSIARRQLDAAGNARWKQYATVLRATYFVALCVAAGFVLLGPAAVSLVFHSALPNLYFMLFGALLFLNLIKQVDDTFITATGVFHVAFYLPILESCTYAALGIVLGKRFGIAGIVVAGIATNLVFAVIGKSVVVARGIFERGDGRMLATKASSLGTAVVLAVPAVLLLVALRSFSISAPLLIAVATLGTAAYVLPIVYKLVRRGYGTSTVPVDDSASVRQGAA